MTKKQRHFWPDILPMIIKNDIGKKNIHEFYFSLKKNIKIQFTWITAE